MSRCNSPWPYSHDVFVLGFSGRCGARMPGREAECQNSNPGYRCATSKWHDRQQTTVHRRRLLLLLRLTRRPRISRCSGGWRGCCGWCLLRVYDNDDDLTSVSDCPSIDGQNVSRIAAAAPLYCSISSSSIRRSNDARMEMQSASSAPNRNRDNSSSSLIVWNSTSSSFVFIFSYSATKINILHGNLPIIIVMHACHAVEPLTPTRPSSNRRLCAPANPHRR